MRIRFLLLLCLIHPLAMAEDYSDWPLRIQLQPRRELSFCYWELDPLVYQYSRDDLGDLRLVDASGKTVPWILTGYNSEKGKELSRYYTSVVTGSEEHRENAFPWSLYFQLERKETLGVNQMELELKNAPYSLQVQVYGRNDRGDWQWITQDSLYNNDAGHKSRIDFPMERKDLHFRVDSAEEIIPLNWKFAFSRNVQSRGLFLRDAGLYYRLEQEFSQTNIFIENPQRLPVTELILQTRGTFKRHLYWDSRTYPFYLFNPGDGSGEITVTHREDRSEEILLVIENGDNEPVEILGIQSFYNSKQLRFPYPEKQPLTLYAGNLLAETPDYDLEFFREALKDVELSEVITSEKQVRSSEGDREKDLPWKMIFQISLAFLSVLLSFLIISILRKGRKL